MPELPDVETYKRYIDSTSLHETINEAKISHKKILEHIDQQKLEHSLRNTKFKESYRHGKYLFLKTTKEEWLVVHFGMTGYVKYFKNNANQPSHTRLLITFENGFHLAFHSQRLLGKLGLAQNKDEYIKDKNLGPDALKISYDSFQNVIEKRRRMIKSILMNQSIIAGVGNIYADEILFQSGIHPKTKVSLLKKEDFLNIYQNMQKIFEVAINIQGKTDEFPDMYIIPNRTKDGICPKGEKKLNNIKVNGRTTYYCPFHQKKK